MILNKINQLQAKGFHLIAFTEKTTQINIELLRKKEQIFWFE